MKVRLKTFESIKLHRVVEELPPQKKSGEKGRREKNVGERMTVREKLRFQGVRGAWGGDARENERIRVLGCVGAVGLGVFFIWWGTWRMWKKSKGGVGERERGRKREREKKNKGN